MPQRFGAAALSVRGIVVTSLLTLVATVNAQQTQPAAEDGALTEKIRERTLALTDGRVQLIGSITVNGQAILRETLQREMVFLIGAKVVETRIAAFLIEEQIERAVRVAGACGPSSNRRVTFGIRQMAWHRSCACR